MKKRINPVYYTFHDFGSESFIENYMSFCNGIEINPRIENDPNFRYADLEDFIIDLDLNPEERMIRKESNRNGLRLLKK